APPRLRVSAPPTHPSSFILHPSPSPPPLQFHRQLPQPAPLRLVHCVPHRVIHALAHPVGHLDPVHFHLLDREPPRVVLLQAPRPVPPEADGVVADLVQEDGAAHRPLRLRRLDQPAHPPRCVIDLPRAPAHAGAPLAHANIVLAQHLPRQRLVPIRHARLRRPRTTRGRRPGCG